ncbi:uncharacterized protein [Gossypium hirsutum]|uniref:Reverse transcriptase RNase H-like domain-containing protein n=1 Tax=Gossypium hirsutum TaxID=3635 RepID=A0ABM3A9H3_GOSHI|nr:uncharacterized protein LOC121218406 [Gossypium hirsutum]
MKEVVNKEIIKWLDVEIIYPISDSNWVSPVQCVPKKSGITVVCNDKDELISTRIPMGWQVCMDYRKLNAATRKDHFPLPFIDQMLDQLSGKTYCCFLDGYSRYFKLLLHQRIKRKQTSPALLVLSLFTVYLSVFATYQPHFKGILLGHHISSQGIQADKAKMEIIEKLPPPINVKLKKKLVNAPIVVAPDWSQPFEVMCDVSCSVRTTTPVGKRTGFDVGVVLGQRKGKIFQAIYYASKTLIEAQLNYTTTEKELLDVVFAFDKFYSYLVGTKVTVFTEHLALRYLFAKKGCQTKTDTLDITVARI